jgi:hypothetical protein
MNGTLKSDVRDWEKKDRNHVSKHRNLQHDYHNLITIASELVQTLASCINGEKITPVYLSSICMRLASFKKQKLNKVEEDDEESEVHQRIKAPSPFKAVPPVENNLVESYQSVRSVSQSPVAEEYMKPAEREFPVSNVYGIEARLDYGSVKQELSVVDGDKAVLLLEALGSVRPSN